MVTIEHDAGVILFREEEGSRLYLLLDYGKHWDFPKGHVGNNEKEESAAIRELEEETGITDVRILEGFRRKMILQYPSKTGGLIRKYVTLFLASTSMNKVVLTNEHNSFAFLPLVEALNLLKPKSQKALRAADLLLSNGTSE